MTEDEAIWPMDSELQTLSMLGTTLAERYKIQRLLGERGMGSVYLATDQLLSRQVAIKIMKAGPMARQNAARFFREARSLARLNHPNIVTLYDYGWHGEQAYLALERRDFLDFLKWHPDVAIRILAVLAQRLRNLNSQLENIIFSDPPARLAETLLKLVETYSRETPEGWEISFPVTLAELSRMAGVPTRTVRRLLRDFQAAGVMSTKNRRFIIHRPGKLRRRALKGAGSIRETIHRKALGFNSNGSPLLLVHPVG